MSGRWGRGHVCAQQATCTGISAAALNCTQQAAARTWAAAAQVVVGWAAAAQAVAGKGVGGWVEGGTGVGGWVAAALEAAERGVAGRVETEAVGWEVAEWGEEDWVAVR